MDLVLAIDLGTSYFKLALFDRAGRMCGLGRVAVQADAGLGPRCELPVERFWSTLARGLGLALEQAKATAGDIQALAYSSQANSFVLLDATDQPLTPLVLWPDSGEGPVHPDVEALWKRPDFLATTGLGVPPTGEFMAAKLRRLRDRQDDRWSKTRRIMTISDYLAFSLTGLAVGDQGTACMLGMMDLRAGRWWPPAMQAVGICESMLSQPLAPGSLAGPTQARAAALLGVPAGVPLAVGSLDHFSAAMGAGLGELAGLCQSTGTVLAAVRCTRDFSPQAGVCLGPSAIGGWDELAFHPNGAAALEWYQREHAPELSIPRLLELAAAAPPGCDGLTALPCANQYAGLKGFRGAPFSRGHGHYVRAILESTARTLGELAGRLCHDGPPRSILATGGGARSDLWLSIKGDLLATEMLRPACQEPACMGAAMIAATAAGWFANPGRAMAAWSGVSARFGKVSPRT